MKKILALLLLSVSYWASAQTPLTTALQATSLLPKAQFGIKFGTNLTSLSVNGDNLSSQNQAGYLVGFWGRIGGAGLQFEPEVYYTSKNVSLRDNAGNTNNVKFSSIDVPLLFGKQFGALGFGGHINTGPLVSFLINKDQSISDAVGKITKLDYKDQAFAWQFGGGIDFQQFNVDVRYELGLSNLSKDGYPDTKIRMFNLSVGYRLF